MWQPIDKAPKDGTPVTVKRVHKGRVVYQGPAAWRTVTFGALFDPLSGEQISPARDATGWMHVDVDHRVPEPTHWLPS
jgi:hypothetical protein